MENKIVGIQGDVLVMEITSLPTGAKKKKDTVLVYGETTGHKHQVVDGDVYEYGDRLFVQPAVNTTIIHEEHDEIGIEKGKSYEIIRQREYTKDNMTKLVVD